MRCVRLVIFLLATMFATVTPTYSHARKTSNSIRQEQSENQRRSAETQRRIRQNMADVQRQLNLLERLEANIEVNKRQEEHLNSQADSIKAIAAALNDSLSLLTGRIAHADSVYQVSLRTIRAQRRSISPLAFIFSSDNVAQAVRRINYLRQLAKWNADQAETLRQHREELAKMIQRTNAVAAQLNNTLLALESAQQRLENDRVQAMGLVSQLRLRGDDLNRVLTQQQRQAEALDRELQRVIDEELAEERAQRAVREAEARRQAEEARRRAEEEARRQAEETQRQRQQAQDSASHHAEVTEQPAIETGVKHDINTSAPIEQTPSAEISSSADLTTSFVAQKGNMIMPVEGQASIVGNFGRRTHSELSRVEIQNNGIDIECQPGASVRAVHDGTVTMVIVMDGFRNVVLLRHGEYLTVYAGLSQLCVHKGQNVRTGDRIGLISDDAEDPNGHRLHFEVRHEKEKLDPSQWLR